MARSDGIGPRLRRLARKKWFTPVMIAVIVVAVFAVRFLGGNDHAEVVHRLEQKYGAEKIVWSYNGKYERDRLVVDGKDVSEHCVVTGDWGSLADLAIECDGEVTLVPRDR